MIVQNYAENVLTVHEIVVLLYNYALVRIHTERLKYAANQELLYSSEFSLWFYCDSNYKKFERIRRLLIIVKITFTKEVDGGIMVM